MKNKNEKPKTEDLKVPTTPVFIPAEEMSQKLATLTRDIADLAFELSRERKGAFGKELDDWFRAENELLRPMPVEITETDDNILVSAAVPGFKPEEIEVSIKDNMLMVNGITELSVVKDGKTILREWKSNRFCRQLMLPAAVVEDKVSARLANGMLELTLPKAAERDVTKVAVATA
jgi:HSP20 family protein